MSDYSPMLALNMVTGYAMRDTQESTCDALMVSGKGGDEVLSRFHGDSTKEQESLPKDLGTNDHVQAEGMGQRDASEDGPGKGGHEGDMGDVEIQDQSAGGGPTGDSQQDAMEEGKEEANGIQGAVDGETDFVLPLEQTAEMTHELRQAHPLQHLLDRVFIPEITNRILLNCNAKTQATCLRVSQTFYAILAPIIYTHLEISNGNYPGIIYGAEYHAPGENIILPARKNQLLSMVKHLSVYWHWDCSPLRSCFQNVKVLYISTYSKCTCGEQCDVCKIEYYNDDNRCPILNGIKPEKLVIANLRAINTCYVSGRFYYLSLKIVTIVISPDNRGLSALQKLLPNVERYYKNASRLRILFAPWSEKTHEHTMEVVQEGRNNHDSGHDKFSAGSRVYVDTLKELKTLGSREGRGVKEVEIYFIDGARFHPWTRDRTAMFPDTHRIRDEVMLAIESQLEEGEEMKVAISWKDRPHYLKEGWTDEIDPRELRRWRREEYGEGIGYDSDEETDTEEVESVRIGGVEVHNAAVDVANTGRQLETNVEELEGDNREVARNAMTLDGEGAAATEGETAGERPTPCLVSDNPGSEKLQGGMLVDHDQADVPSISTMSAASEDKLAPAGVQEGKTITDGEAADVATISPATAASDDSIPPAEIQRECTTNDEEQTVANPMGTPSAIDGEGIIGDHDALMADNIHANDDSKRSIPSTLSPALSHSPAKPSQHAEIANVSLHRPIIITTDENGRKEKEIVLESVELSKMEGRVAGDFPSDDAADGLDGGFFGNGAADVLSEAMQEEGMAKATESCK